MSNRAVGRSVVQYDVAVDSGAMFANWNEYVPAPFPETVMHFQNYYAEKNLLWLALFKMNSYVTKGQKVKACGAS